MTDTRARTVSRSLWYASRRSPVFRERPLEALPEDMVRVETTWSGISRGTERLVYEGRVPASEWERMRAPFQKGEFPYPLAYGYNAVGIVREGPAALVGRTVFALAPHEEVLDLPVDAVRLVPEAVPARRAVLGANAETALNALWDGGAGPGDRIVVVGAGIVGCLVAALAARIAGTEVTLVDVDQTRKSIAEALGCGFRKPLDSPGEADLVFHTSATSEGLSCALACAGDEATVVEMSWYGERAATTCLGAAFHSRRLKLLSSQVGRVSESRRGRWSYARRLDKALALLADPRLDALITEEVAFADLPETLPRLFAPGAPGLATAVRYS